MFAKTGPDNNSFQVLGDCNLVLAERETKSKSNVYNLRTEVKADQQSFKKLCQWGTREKKFRKKSFFLESLSASTDSDAGKTLGKARANPGGSSLENFSQSKLRICPAYARA